MTDAERHDDPRDSGQDRPADDAGRLAADGGARRPLLDQPQEYRSVYSDSYSSRSGRRRERRPRPRRRVSPLAARIMALAVFPVATLFGGLMYVGAYERSLQESELVSLGIQARIFAGALGETAVPPGLPDEQTLNVVLATNVMRRLVVPTSVRARLFGTKGELIADSRQLRLPAGYIRVEDLPPPEAGRGWFTETLIRAYDWFFYLLSQTRDEVPIYREKRSETAKDYIEVQAALRGDGRGFVRRAEQGYLIFSYAVPVQRYKSVFGAVLLTSTSLEIDKAVRRVRLDILQIFAVVMFVTMLLSLYLARGIARPINKLAAAADTMRQGANREAPIPDFSSRHDEIGDLSVALRDLTDELWDRLDAIDSFAADVAHDLKNPLSSLRSAVETAARVKDPAQQQRLMEVILEDVGRLDRLITDISRASRLDKELARVVPEPVDLHRLLQSIVDVHNATREEGDRAVPEIVADLAEPGAIRVMALEDRLVQVFQNVLSNAISFSPPGGKIRIRAFTQGAMARVQIEDDGPGIPDGKLDDIFRRFYSERPAGEKFGTHSGLGLSISRQIVEALEGRIYAENIRNPDGKVRGSRFIIDLPLAGKEKKD